MDTCRLELNGGKYRHREAPSDRPENRSSATVRSAHQNQFDQPGIQSLLADNVRQASEEFVYTYRRQFCNHPAAGLRIRRSCDRHMEPALLLNVPSNFGPSWPIPA